MKLTEKDLVPSVVVVGVEERALVELARLLRQKESTGYQGR